MRLITFLTTCLFFLQAFGSGYADDGLVDINRYKKWLEKADKSMQQGRSQLIFLNPKEIRVLASNLPSVSNEYEKIYLDYKSSFFLVFASNELKKQIIALRSMDKSSPKSKRNDYHDARNALIIYNQNKK